MEKRERKHILVGGLILITLGILIMLHKTSALGFDKSWPILLIVIGIGAIVQRGKDFGGWFITASGLVLLLMQNRQLDIQWVSTYALPLLLIGVGVHVIWKHFRKKE